MSTKQIATPAELGTAFARAALREASDIATFAESVKAAKANTVYAELVKYREAFQAAAKAAGYEATDKLWSRVWTAAKGFGMLGEYPKAATTGATKKAKQRKDGADKLADAIKGKTPVELVALSRTASEAGDISKAADLLNAAKAAQVAADKAAKAKAQEATKEARGRITAALARLIDANDAKGLAKLVAFAEKLSPAPKAAQPATV